MPSNNRLGIGGFTKGYTPWNKGGELSDEHRAKIRKSCVGINQGPKSDETKKKISLAKMGMPSKKAGMKTGYVPKSAFKKGRIPTQEEIKKCLARREKSSLEIKFENIIKKHNLPYKFVGNGEVIIGRKNPDFVNTNGKKIAIEVFYNKHKNVFRGGLDAWKADREKVFKSYGWNVLFFSEIQVNENDVIKAIG